MLAGLFLPEGGSRIGLVAVGGALAFAGAVLGGLLDRRKLDLGQEAADAYRLADTLLERLEAAEAVVADAGDTTTLINARIKHRFDALRVMREMIEQYLSARPDGGEALQPMLSAVSIDISGVAGFEPGEEWTISVFALETDAEPPAVARVGVLWADRLSEQNEGRRWLVGEGFTGVAWQRLAEVIEDDTAHPVAGPYPVPAGKARGYDAERYRSVISVPVRIGPEQRFWGAVTATSNRVGRFSRQASGGAIFANEIIRDIAGFVALLAAADDLSRDEEEAVDDPVAETI